MPENDSFVKGLPARIAQLALVAEVGLAFCIFHYTADVVFRTMRISVVCVYKLVRHHFPVVTFRITEAMI